MTQAIVYVADHCQYCQQTVALLTAQNVSFEERNIDQNETYREQLAQYGTMSVPLTLIEGKPVFGYDPVRMEKLLADLKGEGQQA
ncbi:glutaredoxin family protein [Brevibacillus fulvus]|uniref:Glutaredoxin n=1 Tax=Brevibacillus fulvus TaxID=1125967 RepID=A0A938XZV1_9BACL|nr:glutaredoxin family protein [Brevibacillus fulvus]MBM7591294.1 glutaredoxin [Brevibacillus fulvus]